MLVYVFVRNTNDFISALFQPFGSCLVIIFLIRFCMRVAIYLNDQLGFGTIEICNKSPNGMLAANLESQPAISDS